MSLNEQIHRLIDERVKKGHLRGNSLIMIKTRKNMERFQRKEVKVNIIKKIVTLDFLHGKKAYIGSALIAVIGVLLAFNFITQQQAMALGAVVTAFTAASLRQAM